MSGHVIKLSEREVCTVLFCLHRAMVGLSQDESYDFEENEKELFRKTKQDVDAAIKQIERQILEGGRNDA